MISRPCHICGGHAIFLTTDGKDICRWCHPPFDNDTRNALNNLKAAGMLPPVPAAPVTDT